MTKPVDTPLYPRRSLWERRRDVVKLLTEHPEYSDRRVCRIAVVSRELVSTVRHDLIRRSKIQSCHALKRVGADGKTYKRIPQPRTH